MRLSVWFSRYIESPSAVVKSYSCGVAALIHWGAETTATRTFSISGSRTGPGWADTSRPGLFFGRVVVLVRNWQIVLINVLARKK